MLPMPPNPGANRSAPLGLDDDAETSSSNHEWKVFTLVVHALRQPRLSDDGSLQAAICEVAVLARLLEQRIERARKLKLVGRWLTFDGNSARADAYAEYDALTHGCTPFAFIPIVGLALWVALREKSHSFPAPTRAGAYMAETSLRASTPNGPGRCCTRCANVPLEAESAHQSRVGTSVTNDIGPRGRSESHHVAATRRER